MYVVLKIKRICEDNNSKDKKVFNFVSKNTTGKDTYNKFNINTFQSFPKSSMVSFIIPSSTQGRLGG